MTGTNPFGRSAFLQGMAEELDPPDAGKLLAGERYEDLGAWLEEHPATTAGRDVQVYPQGSGNLGTTNRDPYTGEFDVDLVIRVAYGKSELTQRQLNQMVNGWLGSYVSARQQASHRLAPASLEKASAPGRCTTPTRSTWTSCRSSLTLLVSSTSRWGTRRG